MPRIRLLLPAVAVAAGLAVLLAALQFGGGAAPVPAGDPGPVVRWGYPIVRFLQDGALAVAVGGLVLACFALPPKSASWNRFIDVAAAATGIATVASAATAWLSFRTLVTSELSVESAFTDAFLFFFTEIEAGQVLLLSVVALALLTTLLITVRGHVAVAFVTVLFAVPLGAMAAAGHAGGTEWHKVAVTGMFIHILFSCIWVGGLALLAVLHFTDKPNFGTVAERYSTLALFSFFAVAASGVVSALVRSGWDGLWTTPYGQLALAKTALLVVLGVFGAIQRRRMLPAAREGKTRRFLGFELIIMLVTFGLAGALARTETPIPEVVAEGFDAPARILTGRPLPPPFEPHRLFTEWLLDPLWAMIAACMALFYIWGVIRLRRRGDAWPAHRTVFWVLGSVAFFWLTSGALNVYQFYFFSWHMLTHMMIGMAVPIMLAVGAPITLAMRAIKPRKDGSRGPREWLLSIVHSKYMAVISSPIVASAIFVLSMWVFYYTPIIEWAMVYHLGHIWMVFHFTAAGYLWVSMLLAIDPQPKSAPFPLRILLMLVTMAFHAFFGLSIMTNTTLIAPEYFGAMGNGIDALDDQRVGGGIAWSVGEIPTLILAVVLVVLWAKSDDREAKRVDRKADRDGDADLKAYNEWLERISKR
ncbi:bifunctional copper resistance protein CopD/cytochrome c oxidase assembly protein [uncultured Agrococcus sp.]|uniref:bifunctional copper resistance protein CopD/cytochrome c oxidase assembly protein n=1 Tax=uncultured Agrococcus sp. TaxID=382258 RepID=UPI0025EF39F6|nr:bifunctional copper resistance protein CopD/cytochrome c oxidase assembly protein [uncultured Agrococcus sp.]